MRGPSAPARLAASALAALLLLTGCTYTIPQTSAAPTAAPALATAAGKHALEVEQAKKQTSKTVLLIGDSQSEPADSWPRRGLAAVGYQVHFCGLGGTGFVAASGETGNYLDALLEGDWKLPTETPALIVIQGGGNDAAKGASDQQIVANADRLIAELEKRYPESEMAMIGTLARGASDGGGRRNEVDGLLGTVAARHNLPFIAVGDWLSRYGQAKNLADAVHMNASGREALGSIVARRLRELHLERPV